MGIKGIAAAGVVAALLVVAPAARAHHSFAAEFDSNQVVTLTGKFVKMDWVNPHAWLYMDVPTADGKTERWAVEFGSPNVLFRSGWNKTTLTEGMRVVVNGSGAKDGSLRANSRSVEFPDGRKLDTGSSQGKENVK